MADAFLKVVAGIQQGLNIPLLGQDPLVIGRKRGDLILDDPLVSSTHAQIIARTNGYVLQDLGSTNGTLVDGRLVRETVLRPGSEIAIGSTRMVLFIGLDSPSPSGDAPSLHSASATEIAWLLDEELVDMEVKPTQGTQPGGDVIDQALRLPPGLLASVECVAGADAGKVFRFSRGNVSIGRKTGEIPLTDEEASRRHAVIEVFGRQMIFLRDLGSTNGTYHNGQRITVSRIRNGDTIGVGRSVLKLDIRG
jgi:pSer/pThr/pTyr-binding forkhead associated (FHA) protein